jgi:hypothetical protein
MVLNSVNVRTRYVRWLSSLRFSRPSRKTNLPDDSALEHNQHEKCEKTVVPVLIQAPQGNAKDLKDKEWCCRVFAEELGKGRYGDVEFVASVQTIKG